MKEDNVSQLGDYDGPFCEQQYTHGSCYISLFKFKSFDQFKVSSQSRKFEFNVFSIIHLNGHTFEVLDRLQENKILQTTQIMNNIPRTSKKW